jgi:hypothetical protein
MKPWFGQVLMRSSAMLAFSFKGEFDVELPGCGDAQDFDLDTREVVLEALVLTDRCFHLMCEQRERLVVSATDHAKASRTGAVLEPRFEDDRLPVVI